MKIRTVSSFPTMSNKYHVYTSLDLSDAIIFPSESYRMIELFFDIDYLQGEPYMSLTNKLCGMYHYIDDNIYFGDEWLLADVPCSEFSDWMPLEGYILVDIEVDNFEEEFTDDFIIVLRASDLSFVGSVGYSYQGTLTNELEQLIQRTPELDWPTEEERYHEDIV